MNNTTKAQYDMARKMLKGRIAIDEVVIMSGLPMEEVTKMYDEMQKLNAEAAAFNNMDVKDFNMPEVIVDNYEDDFEELFKNAEDKEDK